MIESGDEIEGKLLDYFHALQRIVSNRPEIVPKGSPITLRSVSLEAGRKGDSIKRARPQFRHLVAAIDNAAEQQRAPRKETQRKTEEARAKLKAMTAERDAAIGREISLLYEVYHLKQKLKDLTGAKILPLYQPKKQDNAGSDQ